MDLTMAKRTFPLICIDRRRTIGEFDTIICTDINSGFVANVYYENEDELTQVANKNLEYVSSESRQGVYLHAKVERIIGNNPNENDIRSLLTQAMKKYIAESEKPINIARPSTSDMIKFLGTTIQGNRHYLAECGSDVKNRQIIETSLVMLSHIKQFIEDHEEEGGDQ